MHYKTNRLNHDFQIAYFIAGSCQTADAAYSILCDLREDRSNALKSFTAYSKRDQAKVKKAEIKLADWSHRAYANDEQMKEIEVGILEAEADIDELRAMADTTQKNYDAALAELSFIEQCMEKLQPYRQFAHLPDAQAHEAAQFNEWKLQLIHTAQNHLLSTNNIPADHWATMRMHPAFEKEILPQIDQFVKLKLQAGSKEGQLALTAALVKKNYELPVLLEAPKPKPQLLDSEQEPKE
jgi:chromosome condensin MukBEF ATPase and DNA-binding subunit MukB